MDREQRAAATTATVDLRITQLVEELGQSNAVAMAVRAFLGRLPSAIDEIVAAPDATAREMAAHTLAGSAETLGAMALGATARSVMREARAEPTGTLDAMLAETLRLEADAATTAFDAALARIGG